MTTINTDHTDNNVNNTYLFIIGIIGISIIIVIHELGHFIAAQFFNIPTPTFSIGFGPTLLRIPLGTTMFQIALLPLGGYVEIDQVILEQQSYVHKIIVMLAGIIFNIVFSALIMIYFYVKKSEHATSLRTGLAYMQEYNKNHRGIIGPIGLIFMIGRSFLINKQIFLLILAIISLNIAFFNILPLPFLDGGKVLLFTIQAIMGRNYPATSISLLSFVIFFIFIVLICCISIKDIKNVNKQ